MKIFVVGSGRLAQAILSAGVSFSSGEIMRWETAHLDLMEKVILVHAGSGRQLRECLDFCNRTKSIFIELSTGLETEKISPDFPLIICPNTSMLVLKIMRMIKSFGHYFATDQKSILESHQSSKTSAPGTAIDFANSLQIPVEDIVSVRDPQRQLNEIGIPSSYLGKHAYHKIVIEDGVDQVVIETKVLGHDSYAKGVKKIIDLVLQRNLEARRYSVIELIDAM